MASSREIDLKTIHYQPIGVFRSEQVHPYEAGRQPDERHSPGWIELASGQNFEQALLGLEGFSHLWILFQFHHNENWKSMVSPPRGTSGKVGVFASRSPYRPNNIGMSVVRLSGVEGLKIHVSEADILEGSPILDIKPYLAYADAKPEATLGWIANEEKYWLTWSKLATEQLSWLRPRGVTQLEGFVLHQLEYEPTNGKKKRVKPHAQYPLSEDRYILAYRTWRILFALEEKMITILSLSSGYANEDLDEKAQAYVDTHADKELHRAFLATDFSS